MTDRDPLHLDGGRSRAAREVMDRAIRRLNILESLILAGAAVAALVGGWLTAFLAQSAIGLPFRPTWFVASLALFVVPGFLVWSRERRARRPSVDGTTQDATGDSP